ncbi:type II secretion system F family protein [Nocardioides cavernaquae]|uniref:Type II secretion system protein n=1 Tax=Nocardioides cavernaquae TaxID=2321396 RepID=A0A3A5H855_9ACTN|nr:type II secretion system F family protein [Nocardioides cavernaquae]RJS46048.1 type II secretion system protein [Nocardioides cavernaquae]
MDVWAAIAVASATGGAALLVRPRLRIPAAAPAVVGVRTPDSGLLRRGRALWAALAGCAGWLFLPGALGGLAAIVLAYAVWTVAARAEPPGARRRREEVRRGLPHVTRLLAIALAGGQAVPAALAQVAAALPGPASEDLAAARSRLAIGVPSQRVWAELSSVPGLEALGRVFARAEVSGAQVADVVSRLADELAAEARAGVEDRARSVGIKAAVPLGLCLLPAFLLLGIVPVVAAAVTALRW